MGCNCGNSVPSSDRLQRRIAKAQSNIQLSDEPCEFSIQTVQAWLEKVYCFKKNALWVTNPIITRKKLNAYLGTLLSATHRDNICSFRPQLNEIQAFIMTVTLTGQCATTT